MTPRLREAVLAAFNAEAEAMCWPADKVARVHAALAAVRDWTPIPEHELEDDDAVGTQLDYFGLWHLAR